MTFLLAITTLFCKAQTNKTDTTLKYLLLGDIDGEYCRAENIVAKKYGFSLVVVAGCVVTHEFDDSVTMENKRVYKILGQRFGKNWQIKFRKEIDTMMELQAKVKELVQKEPYMNDGLRYLIEPVGDQNIFSVKLYGWRRENEKVSHVTFFKLTVNLAKKTVTKESDTIELFEDPLDPKK
jgi:hypothetical protein